MKDPDEEEEIPAAKMFAANDITAFLLDYRIPRVGIMSFSAGGHLMSTIGTHWKNKYDNSLGITLARPNFLVLVYPVIGMEDGLTHERSRKNFLGNDITPERIKEFSNELQVTEDTPPTFIVHSLDDEEVKVENSLYFEAALRQHHVPVEIFLYAKGGHGFGIENETATVQWTSSCIEWIKKEK